MDASADRRRNRRRLIVFLTGGLVLLTLIGVGVFGLLRGPSVHGDSTDPVSDPATARPESRQVPRGPAPIRPTGDPEEFARRVATALFTWDAAPGTNPSDFAQVVVDVGDGSEIDALASDVRGYLPTAQAWAQLRTYQASQSLTIDTINVPESWETAVSQAGPGQLPDGATAYTVTGTRHRIGTWGTVPQEADRPVSFTLFLSCPDDADACSLVRLSALDNPLR